MPKPRKQDGVVYSRKDGKILWIRYRDRSGKPCRESTQTEDWQEANKLRELLQARDRSLPYVPIKATKRICAAQPI